MSAAHRCAVLVIVVVYAYLLHSPPPPSLPASLPFVRAPEPALAPPAVARLGRAQGVSRVSPGLGRSQPISSGLERSRAVSSGLKRSLPPPRSTETYCLARSRVGPVGHAFGTRDDQGPVLHFTVFVAELGKALCASALVENHGAKNIRSQNIKYEDLKYRE